MKTLFLFLVILFLYTSNFAQNIKNADKSWFEWQPDNTLEAGVIGMENWLDAPAGKHGWLHFSGSGFEFEDGTPIKFWGVNHSGKGCGPEKEEADRRAEWYAKMGVNGIRMHKYTYSSSAFGNPQNSTELIEKSWKRLDYYWNRLKEKGIYYGWSPVFRHYLVDGDSDRVIAYNEIKENLDGNIIYLVNFAPDLQCIMFDLATHMLDHRNPHSALRYADDPALIFSELQNEDNIFWLRPDRLESVPTYKKCFASSSAASSKINTEHRKNSKKHGEKMGWICSRNI